MTPFFFGPQANSLYGVYHPPASPRATSQQVLLCPPFGQEAVRIHRLYVVLADQLARQGAHVMRFDYRGTGESAGDDETGTLEQWREDILLAHGELNRRTRARDTTWVGCRLGATLALMASGHGTTPPQRIVLWEPVLDGPAYLEELGKAHARYAFDPFIQTQRPAAQIEDEVIGFGVSQEWIRQVQDISVDKLSPQMTEACTHVASEQDAAATRLAEQLRSQGVNWQHLPSPVDLAWHEEEAGASALAPPQLLRLLLAATKGESK